MKDHYWRAISIDCIDPDYFPAIPLFMKTSGNYVLYKDAERQFSDADRKRMERTNTEFMYVRSGDMEEIATYLETSLKEMLSSDDLDSTRKGRILYQTSINYLVDAFEAPEHASNLERCRQLVQHLMEYVGKDDNALRSLQSVVGHNLYIFTHSVQVVALNLLAHEKLFNVEPDELQDVGIGSLLHDYGMIFVTNEILNKPDALSDVEYYKIKQHTQKGYDFLKDCSCFNDVSLTVVRHHHERYDGNGYPAGLKGDRIPRSAQLSALCDTYSALTLDRVYRKAVSHQDALRMMREESGKAFAPGLLSEFIELVNEKKE
ncbi:HD domain-containing protein [Geomonas nitrogeniifigens]|uniref:HD domain-containing protein n=1 Tax=Geomonas diazotrophica TaxID=2843197 RepID=A0ABX8JIX3_9BACT|nr:HD domain-containing phosphohydrolase [Geomonas nitrogeniifigens]QWV97457.1 HD domain-containing protein [Geomonas nitrogeniifigens]